jgi:hypothetical protein
MMTDSAAKRERAKRLATDYSASQRERDNQDRARGAQKRGTVTEGAEKMSMGSMDRQTKRVDRPPLSETTEVETKLHSANEREGHRPQSKVSSEAVTNRKNREQPAEDTKKFAKDYASKHKERRN